jgi:hypothetical protein
LSWCGWKFEHEKRNFPMRYTQPKINSTYSALSVIKNEKGSPNDEVGTILLTNGAAYQSEE